MKKQNQEIIKKIKKLAEIKPRPEWVDLSRDILLSEIRQTIPRAKIERTSLKDYSELIVSFFQARVFQPALVFGLILVVFLVSGLIVNAAFYSLPGDTLYPIKIALEKTQIAVTPSDQKKAELKMESAKKRVDEFSRLVQRLGEPEEQREKIGLVVDKFKEDVVSLENHINSLEQAQKPVAHLAQVVDDQTTELAKTLKKKQKHLPAAVQKKVKIAINQAVSSAEKTGLSALKVVINKAEEEDVSEEVVIALVKNKIEDVEEEVNTLTEDDNQSAQEAQKAIDEAKELLKNGEFDQAVDKISESKAIIVEGLESGSGTSQGMDLTETPTSTEITQDLDILSGLATSTAEQGVNEEALETTDEVIIK